MTPKIEIHKAEESECVVETSTFNLRRHTESALKNNLCTKPAPNEHLFPEVIIKDAMEGKRKSHENWFKHSLNLTT